MNYIRKMLKKVSENSEIYLGKRSIKALSSYSMGYISAIRNGCEGVCLKNIQEEEDNFNRFSKWMMSHYFKGKLLPSSGYALTLQLFLGDECQAFSRFAELFNEYADTGKWGKETVETLPPGELTSISIKEHIQRSVNPEDVFLNMYSIFQMAYELEGKVQACVDMHFSSDSSNYHKFTNWFICKYGFDPIQVKWWDLLAYLSGGIEREANDRFLRAFNKYQTEVGWSGE